MPCHTPRPQWGFERESPANMTSSSQDRHQRTLSDWAHSAIRSMLSSPDPIAIYVRQDAVIRTRIRTQLGYSHHAQIVVISSALILAAMTVVVILAQPAPPLLLIALPIGGIALVLSASWRSHRRARLKELIEQHEATDAASTHASRAI